MEIKKLFGRETNQASSQAVQKSQVSAYQDQAQSSGTRSVDQDSVSISSLSRQLSQISDILTKDEESRSARVAELKQKVQNGTFSADPDDVARSLISFAADSSGVSSV